MGFFSNIIKTIAKVTRPTYKFENNQLHFKIDDEYFSFALENYDMKTRHDAFVLEAYTISSENIFLEHIKTDATSAWRGEPFSIYEGFFKQKLNIKRLEVLEKFEFSNYEFKTVRVDDSFILHFIYVHGIDVSTIIIDTKGELYQELLSRLKSAYEYKFEDEEKGSVNFNISIVKENSIRQYIRVEESDR